MRGVVLSGGAGTRLRPITFSMAKQLVPVANKPILFYGLEDMVEAGITEVAIIISPATGDEVRLAVGDGSALGLSHVEYIVQDEPLGLAHALGCALPWVDGHDVLMYLGDNLVKDGVADVVSDFERRRPHAQILLTEVDDPRSFGVAELDAAGRVTRLVEKPSRPRSNLALVGVYLFDGAIGDAIQAIKPSARGELEITDAIQWLVDAGRTVEPTTVSGWWKDTGRKSDLLHANELVLSDLRRNVEGDVIDSDIRGAVSIGAGARVVDSVITGPAVIGAGTHLTRVRVGPNTSIGSRCELSDSWIEESIVMDDVEVHGFRLRDSLVGRSCRLRTRPDGPWTEVTLGERGEIEAE